MSLTKQFLSKLRQLVLVSFLFPSLSSATAIVYDIDSPPYGPYQQLDVDTMSAGYDSNALYLTLTYIHDTFSAVNLNVEIGLDIDRSWFTGGGSALGIGRLHGADYVVSILSPLLGGHPGTALVYQSSFNTPQELIGSIPVVYGIDSFSVIIPLTMLGNDDGVMDFAAQSLEFIEGPTFEELFSFGSLYFGDFVGRPKEICLGNGYCYEDQIFAGPSTVIPEPDSKWLLVLGLSALLLIQKNRSIR